MKKLVQSFGSNVGHPSGLGLLGFGNWGHKVPNEKKETEKMSS